MKTRLWSKALLVLVIMQCLLLSTAVAWPPDPPPWGWVFSWLSTSWEYCEVGSAEGDCLYWTCNPEVFRQAYFYYWDGDACACYCGYF
jgi:hypothetical protein